MTITTIPPDLEYTIEGRDENRFSFRGRRLGHGTSWRDGRPRWFEVDIYKATTGTYIVHTQGRSEVAGEKTLARILRTQSAFEIIEMLTVTKCDVCASHTCQSREHTKRLYLPRQSSHALAQAAQWDDDIRDAYVNRAVL